VRPEFTPLDALRYLIGVSLRVLRGEKICENQRNLSAIAFGDGGSASQFIRVFVPSWLCSCETDQNGQGLPKWSVFFYSI